MYKWLYAKFYNQAKKKYPYDDYRAFLESMLVFVFTLMIFAGVTLYVIGLLAAFVMFFLTSR